MYWWFGWQILLVHDDQTNLFRNQAPSAFFRILPLSRKLPLKRYESKNKYFVLQWCGVLWGVCVWTSSRQQYALVPLSFAEKNIACYWSESSIKILSRGLPVFIESSRGERFTIGLGDLCRSREIGHRQNDLNQSTQRISKREKKPTSQKSQVEQRRRNPGEFQKNGMEEFSFSSSFVQLCSLHSMRYCWAFHVMPNSWGRALESLIKFDGIYPIVEVESLFELNCVNCLTATPMSDHLPD